MNRLYYGDCLTLLQDPEIIPTASVDLIYLDPPFNSQRGYNAIYTTETGQPLPDQIEAFCDMWELDAEREQAIRHMPVLMREAGIDDDVAEFWRTWLNALRGTQPRLLAYLSYMVQRLLPMRRILKPTGSIYYHCDPTASHYVKVMLDGIFGHANFQNEIVWKRTSAHSSARRWGPIHDAILFYSRGDRHHWNRILEEHDPEYVARFYRYKDAAGRMYRVDNLTASGRRSGESGQPWRGVDPTEHDRHWTSPGGASFPSWIPVPDGYDAVSVQERLDLLDRAGLIHWPKRGGTPAFKRYLATSPGRAAQDIVLDISPISAGAHERMGYPTQKPVALLERIISASTKPGDVVLDPFAGCATTMEAAQNLGRQWIGIDIAIHAIKRVARVRLVERLGLVEGKDFTIEGVPRNVEGARDLWERDKYQFQKWAVEHADGFVTSRKTSDGGIDGRLYFAVPEPTQHGDAPLAATLESMVIEVKGGRSVGIADVRALRGVLDGSDALMAGLIVLDAPSPTKARNFERFMADAGVEEILGIEYPRMQMLTAADLLDGRRFRTPTVLGQHSTQQPAFPGIPAPD